MGRIGPLEIGILFVLVLIIFGVGKLPQVGGALGKGVREFRQGITGREEAAKKEASVDSSTKPPSTEL